MKDMDTCQAAPDAPKKGKCRFFINRAFGLLWLGQAISNLGSHITGSGLQFVAILLLGATPIQMGLLAALGSAPVLLFGLLAGVWVDRLPRRPIMIVSDLGRALLLFSIPLAAVLGLLRVGQLYVVTALVGTLTVFFEVASQAFLPMIVRREQIMEGNSKLEASSSLAEIAGPSLGGVLVQAITAPIAILFDALSFLVSALCVGCIRMQELPSEITEKRQSMWHEIREGLIVLLSNPLLRATTAWAATHTFFGGAFATLYGLYIIRIVRVTPAVYGLLVTMGGVGAFLGALATARLVRRFGVGVTLIGAALLDGGLTLLTPLAWGPKPIIVGLLLLGQFIGDFGYMIACINELSLRQTVITERMLGRVNASMRFLVGGVAPIGAIIAGVLSEHIGIRPTLLIGASGIALSTIWLFFSPIRRL